jgi:hypothetical protein
MNVVPIMPLENLCKSVRQVVAMFPLSSLPWYHMCGAGVRFVQTYWVITGGRGIFVSVKKLLSNGVIIVAS